MDSLSFLGSSEVLVSNFLVDEVVLDDVELVLESNVVVLDVGEVGDNSSESGVLLVGKTESGLVVATKSSESRTLSSGGVKVSG